MLIISQEIIVSRGAAICHMVFMYHSHHSYVHSWTTYELGTEIFPPTFRNSLELVTSSESFCVTLCVYWIDKSVSTSQFWLVRNKMSAGDSVGCSPPVFRGLVWAKIWIPHFWKNGVSLRYCLLLNSNGKLQVSIDRWCPYCEQH